MIVILLKIRNLCAFLISKRNKSVIFFLLNFYASSKLPGQAEIIKTSHYLTKNNKKLKLVIYFNPMLFRRLGPVVS